MATSPESVHTGLIDREFHSVDHGDACPCVEIQIGYHLTQSSGG